MSGTIYDQLSGSGRMNGSHEPFSDAEVLVEYLREGSQTIGGT